MQAAHVAVLCDLRCVRFGGAWCQSGECRVRDRSGLGGVYNNKQSRVRVGCESVGDICRVAMRYPTHYRFMNVV